MAAVIRVTGPATARDSSTASPIPSTSARAETLSTRTSAPSISATVSSFSVVIAARWLSLVFCREPAELRGGCGHGALDQIVRLGRGRHHLAERRRVVARQGDHLRGERLPAGIGQARPKLGHGLVEGLVSCG